MSPVIFIIMVDSTEPCRLGKTCGPVSPLSLPGTENFLTVSVHSVPCFVAYVYSDRHLEGGYRELLLSLNNWFPFKNLRNRG